MRAVNQPGSQEPARSDHKSGMQAAVCCFYEAFPPASGAANVSYDFARFLPGQRILIQAGAQDRRVITADGIEIVSLAGAAESRREKLVRLPGLLSRMLAEIERSSPDLVILEGASWALYHLLLVRRLRHNIPQAKIIYHSHNVEYLLRLRRNRRAIAALTRWAEGRLLRCADLCTAVSEVDQDHFARLYGIKPILLPNAVDAERFARVSTGEIARMRCKYGLDRSTLLFSGFYAYPPNREAVDFLVTAVMPALRKRYPSATLALTGGGAPYREPWIRNVGSVTYGDLPAFVAACGVAVAPIFSGSGTRLKILEAMAAGVPVIATEKAAEGLGLRPHEHFLLAHTPQEFVGTIGALLEDSMFAKNLRRSASHKVRTQFSWYFVMDNFQKAVGAAQAQPSSRRSL